MGMRGAREMHILLERERELSALEGTLEELEEGRGSSVLVRGPAGIGKSELLHAARSRAEDRGFTVVSARGGEFERSFGFGVARQLFETTLREASEEERASLLQGAASLAAPALMLDGAGSKRGSVAMGDPAAPIQHGLHWLVANLSERAPVIISVDDLQWADAESARWLLYLARRVAEMPVVIVAAIRSGEPGIDPDLLAALESESTSRVIRPETLSDAGGAELVRLELGAEADPEFCLTCQRAAGGNPFLLRELIEAARSEGVPPTADSAERVVDLSPGTVSRSVMVRLGRLPESAALLTRAVAVLGDGVSPSRAGSLAELEPSEVARAADLLADAAILAVDGTLAFAHPLIRAAVYSGIPVTERALDHGRAAALLAEDGATPEEVAAQLLHSEPRGDSHAVATLRAAAADATSRAAPQAAVAYLRRAFEEGPPGAARAELLGELLTAATMATDLRAFDGVSKDPVGEICADDEVFREVGADLVAWLFLNGRIPKMTEVIERGIANFAADGDHAMALRHEFLALSVIDITPPNAIARLEAHADRLRPGTQEERAWFAMRGWWQHILGGAASESIGFVRQGIDKGQLLELPDLGPIFGQAVLVLIRADELEEAAGWVDRMVEDAHTRSPAYMASALGLRSWLAQRRGDLPSADLDARRTVEICKEHRVPLALAINLRWLFDVLLEQGRLDDAETELRLAGLDGVLPDFWWFAPLRFARARLLIAQGETELAIEELRQRLAWREETHPHSDPIASTLALALHSLGREPDAVKRLIDWELESAREWGTPRGIGAALRGAGLVESGSDGIELLEESVETLRHSPARLELARSLTELGSALRRANRRSDARAPLRKALDIAHRCSATVIEARAREELAATGARPRRAALDGIEGLTPSELRVATMAAAGRGNREIAQELFVTVKTVETHLGSAYRKLDISSRRELPRALRVEPGVLSE
jgi:DNA-binding CsgD family transcriptional regulator